MFLTYVGLFVAIALWVIALSYLAQTVAAYFGHAYMSSGTVWVRAFMTAFWAVLGVIALEGGRYLGGL